LISKQLSNSIMFIHTNIHQITLKKTETIFSISFQLNK
jgi:hypothetical protein